MVTFNPTSVQIGIVVHPSVTDTLLTAQIEPTWVVQDQFFNIFGKLTRTDTGAALSGMTITLSGGTQSASTTTDALGLYFFSGLKELVADSYSYTISFAGITVPGLTLKPSNALTGVNISGNMNAPLIVGGIAALSVILMAVSLK